MSKKQHQPLRVPAGWTGQDKTLVIQIERTFEDVYNLSGNLEDDVQDLYTITGTIQSTMVTDVAYDSGTQNLTITVNGATSNIVKIATLDGNGKVPASQLPSYVDDVEEYADTAHFPPTGEADKIYVAMDTGFTYRWSGSQYVRLNTYDEATQIASGLMSAADKTKLDGIEAGANNYSLPLSASGTRGGIKIGYTENNKKYAVKLDNEKAYVEVPWSDTVYSLPLSANGTRGGIQIGYTENNKKYAVKLDNEKAYVEVPWSDTIYSLPLAASGTRGGMQIGYSESGQKYAVKLSSEKAYVEVPWTDTKNTAGTTDLDPNHDGTIGALIVRNTNNSGDVQQTYKTSFLVQDSDLYDPQSHKFLKEGGLTWGALSNH